MFGYVNVYKDELKIKDFNVYRAYYCGLCKALGDRFGAFARLGLSYDFTFLAIFLDSLSDEKVNFKTEGCARHIGKKHLAVKENFAINYAADMSVALNYFKILDDIKDEIFTKSLFLYLPYKFAMGKNLNINGGIMGDITDEIKNRLNVLSELEKEKCAEPDLAADAFAKIMSAIFSVKSGLYDFGYNLGKFIYLIDALDDLKKDIKRKSYNPYFEKFGNDFEKIRKSAEFVLTFTLSSVAEEFEKQKIYKNNEILKNIIYLGLRFKLDGVLAKIN